jgi:hypothetical protein
VNENYTKLRNQGKSEEEINQRMQSIIESLEEVRKNDDEDLDIEELTEQNKILTRSFNKSSSVDDNTTTSDDDENNGDKIVITENHPKVSFDDNLLPALRKSFRSKKPIDRLLFQVENTHSNNEKELPKQQFIEFKHGDVLPPTPSTIKEALAEGNRYKTYWLEAIMNEMTDRDVFTYVDEKQYLKENNGKKPNEFKSKLAFRVTTTPLNILEREGIDKIMEVVKFKARLVACGYSQVLGIHYDRSNFPTACFRSIMTLLHITIVFGWVKAHFDIGNAYLEPDIDKEIYMYLPLDWTFGRPILVKLNKNLYGLKQAGLLWYLLMKKVLIELNYLPSIWDPCIFIKRRDNNVISIIGVHVDDEAIISNDSEEIKLFKAHLNTKKFRKVSDLSSLTEFLGIKIATNETSTCFYLSQEHLIDKYIRELAIGIGEIKTSLPGPSNINVEDIPPNKHNNPIWSEIGTISHFALHTRPDLACISGILGKIQRYPNEAHLKILKQVNDYIQ